MLNRLLILLIVIIVVISGALLFIPKKKTEQESTSGSKTSLTAQEINQVALTDKGFSPESITIKAGESVKWINAGSQNGSVNSNPHPTHALFRFLNLGEFPPGSTVEAKFENTGTYGYHNHFNPTQQGTVVVK